MRLRAIVLLATCAAAGLSATPARAQLGLPGAPMSPDTLPQRDLSFVASLIVPGTGQYLLSQGRWVPYLAVETWAWVRYAERRRTAERLAVQYRDLAWSVARRVSIGARRDTTFPYYEVLTKAGASGAYDAQPSVPGIQPEQDAGTYNGEQWQLARALFLPPGESGEPGTAAYAAALAYYEAHAIPDAYAFAWTTGRLEQQVYGNVIAESDAAYSDAARLLGLILANHLTSSIDALISARLRDRGVNVRIESGLLPDDQAEGSRVPVRLETRIRYTW